MPQLFSRLAGREALAWIKHRRWWMFYGASPTQIERDRVTGDGQIRFTGDGVTRVVRVRVRELTRATSDGQERVTAGGQTRDILFAN